MFTKTMKPILGQLRMAGHESVSYLDDLYLQAGSYQDSEDPHSHLRSIVPIITWLVC